MIYASAKRRNASITGSSKKCGSLFMYNSNTVRQQRHCAKTLGVNSVKFEPTGELICYAVKHCLIKRQAEY